MALPTCRSQEPACRAPFLLRSVDSQVALEPQCQQALQSQEKASVKINHPITHSTRDYSTLWPGQGTGDMALSHMGFLFSQRWTHHGVGISKTKL